MTTERSARVWTEAHPGTFVLSLDDAVRLGQVWGRQCFPTWTQAADLHYG